MAGWGLSEKDPATGMEYIQVSEMFYCEGVQSVLLFSFKFWSILETTTSNVEGTNVGFLRQVTGKREHKTTDGTWATPAAVDVFGADGM